MKLSLSRAVLVLLVLFLPGCTRLVDWARDSFYQGQNLCYDKDLARNYIRSISLYDQFATRAHFDVIWLSDQVRTMYVELHARKTGMNEEKKSALLDKQLAENHQYIVFYMISSVETLFVDPLSEWSVYLQVGDAYFEPTQVKGFDLELEYRAFFGKRYNRFRTPYRIAFKVTDQNRTWLLSPDADRLFLHVQSLDKKTVFEWKLDDTVQTVYQERENNEYKDCNRC